MAGRLIPGDHGHIGRNELIQMIEGSLSLAIISFKGLLKAEPEIGKSPIPTERKRLFDGIEEV